MPVNAENFVKLELAQGICLRLCGTLILQNSVNFQFWSSSPYPTPMGWNLAWRSWTA